MRAILNSVVISALCVPQLAAAQMVSTVPLPPVPQAVPFGAEPQPEPTRVREEAPMPVRATIWVPPSGQAPVQARPAMPPVVRSNTVLAMRAPLAAPVAAPFPQMAPKVAPVTATVSALTPAAPFAVAPVTPVQGGQALLPANTDVMLRLDEEVSSKRKRVGDRFRLSVAHDVMLGGYVVIPRGTPAYGSLSYRTGKGAFGKSAKIEIELESISLAGRTIPIVGHFRQEGQGNTGATIGTAVAAGLIAAAFVTGRSAIFEQGREFRVATRQPLAVTIPD